MKKGFTNIERIVIVGTLLLGLVLVIGIPFVSIFVTVKHDTGSGTQVGYVSAVEKTGIIFKTGRAYIKPTLESTQEDEYCVIDDSVLAQLEKVSTEKKIIEVKHFSWLFTGLNCEGENAIIKSFKEI